ncbi:MAG: fatty acid--CoA ligase [Planctomycetota bacterium]|nr:MAG: fatty acid--CoA ligase [Planctomycetota bacterium]
MAASPSSGTPWIAPPVQQLLVRDLLTRARNWSPRQTITYRDLREHTYSEFIDRIDRAAAMLVALGVKPGDRVGVMDWDSHRYLELFFAVPMLGAVLHTVNVRLTAEQIGWTIRHAGDSVVLTNPDFLPIAEALAPHLPRVRTWVSLSDDGVPPLTTVPLAGDYEQLLEQTATGWESPDLDENTVATLFYTTGTTGDPKGVYFTHRQIVLHTLAAGVTFAAHQQPVGIHAADAYLPLTPMFHVHAWGIPYLATMLGLKQVYPGKYDPQQLAELIKRHSITFSHCVPTLVQMLLHHPAAAGIDYTGLKLVVGGAPLPQGLAAEAMGRGIRIMGGYGMSETCPVVAAPHWKPEHALVDDQSKLDVLCRTGFAFPLVQARIWGGDDRLLPEGSREVGELVLRCPWLTAGYYCDEERSRELWRGGWLHTGDIAFLDRDGYIRITDRLKDVIKIGGEWISSQEIESVLSRHEGVKEVAVVAQRDPKWDERPHADVVLHDGHAETVTPRELGRFLHRFIDDGSIHKRAVLTEIRIVKALPRTSVGKIDKKEIRRRLAES